MQQVKVTIGGEERTFDSVDGAIRHLRRFRRPQLPIKVWHPEPVTFVPDNEEQAKEFMDRFKGMVSEDMFDPKIKVVATCNIKMVWKR